MLAIRCCAQFTSSGPHTELTCAATPVSLQLTPWSLAYLEAVAQSFSTKCQDVNDALYDVHAAGCTSWTSVDDNMEEEEEDGGGSVADGAGTMTWT